VFSSALINMLTAITFNFDYVCNDMRQIINSGMFVDGEKDGGETNSSLLRYYRYIFVKERSKTTDKRY
jgi:hypothetical protein